jgi:branched-chain amino acid transport system permease protein
VTGALLGRAARTGLLAGLVLVYLGLVGMIEKFGARNLVGEVLTLSRLLIVAPPFLGGYLLVRTRVSKGQIDRPMPGPGIAGGAVAGAVAGVVVVLAILVAKGIGIDTIRGVFIEVTQGLISTLTFGRDLGSGSVMLVLVGAAGGAVGSAYRYLPARRARPLAVATTVVLLAAVLQRIVPTVLFQLGLDTAWLYDPFTLGLTYLGAAILFVVSGGAVLLWIDRRSEVRDRMLTWSPQGRRTMVGLWIAVVLFVLAVLPQLLGSVLSQILGSVAIYVLMGLGLNIVVGYAGLLDLGYVAFFAVGAYATALFTGGLLITSVGQAAPAISLHLSFYAAVPLVIAFAAFVGVLIGAPVLRLRGDYLAIVTLGFGEIASRLAASDWLKPVVGGAQGMRRITDASIFGISFRDPQNFAYLAIAFSILAIFVSVRLADSRIGRAWQALREDEQVAEAMGISTTKFKLLAFALGGGIGCLSGALFAVQIGSLNPTSFEILVSITVLAVVILGGMGSIPGVIVGAMVLIGIPGLLSEFEEFKLLIYGAVLVGIMVLRPEGLVPNIRRATELKEEERAQDQWLRDVGSAPATEEGAAAREPA